MTAAMQDKGRGPAATEPSRDAAGKGPLRIAPRDARDAHDPQRPAPSVWYIEDTPDMALPGPRADRNARTL